MQMGLTVIIVHDVEQVGPHQNLDGVKTSDEAPGSFYQKLWKFWQFYQKFAKVTLP